jgi:3-methyladenine DNA glycosylase/8-oxoguanine DNA glycosylase
VPAVVHRPAAPVDLARTLAPLVHGRGDPCRRRSPDGVFWYVTRTVEGPATLRLTADSGEIRGEAWGPGADRVLADVPDLCGARDDWSGFDPQHPLLERTLRRCAGLRLTRTGNVFESLVPAVLEQKVTGKEAMASWRTLVLRYGEPAPGPAPQGMRVPPGPDQWRRIPSWDWHRAGVDPRRMRTVVAACQVAGRLQEAAAMEPEAALVRLRAVDGVGVWTAAEVAQRAFGDPDTVSVGDYHLAAFVGWALLGRPVDDDGMLELLEPWRGHRQRVVRLLELSGASKPRFGARMTIQDHRGH